MKCKIFKTKKRDEMYLYVRDNVEYKDLPDNLLTLFGEPEHVMDLELSKDKPLAREDVLQVMANLQEQGFFLQLPPSIVNNPQNS